MTPVNSNTQISRTMSSPHRSSQAPYSQMINFSYPSSGPASSHTTNSRRGNDDIGKPKKFPAVNSNGTKWDGWESYYRILQEEQSEANGQQWTGDIPFDEKLRYLYVVTCPSEEETNTYIPEGFESVGSVLKTWQKKYKCFLWYLPNIYNNTPGFGIAGNAHAGVIAAAEQCQGIAHCLFANVKVKARHHTFWLVKQIPPRNLQSRVAAIELLDHVQSAGAVTAGMKYYYQLSGAQLDQRAMLEAIGSPIFSLADLEPGEVPIGSPNADHINALYLEAFLMKAFDPLRYFHGKLRLVVSIGNCLVEPYQGSVGSGLSLQTFKDRLARRMNTQEDRLKSDFTSHLAGITDAVNLQHGFCKATGFLPLQDHTKPARHIDVLMFLPDEGTRLRFEISFSDDGFAKSRKWSIVRPPHKLLQINLLDLQDAKLSYNIALEHPQTIEVKDRDRQISPAQSKLANGIALNPITGKMRLPLAAIIPPAKLLQMVDKRTWSYNADQGYVIDVTRFHIYEVIEGGLCERPSCWRVSVRHSDWETNFAENSRLHQIGDRTDWRAEEPYFFPVKTDDIYGKSQDRSEARAQEILPRVRAVGCKKLLEVLKAVDEVIKAATSRRLDSLI